MNLAGAVASHKKLIYNLMNQSEQELTIRLPVARVSSGVNPLFGDSTRETDKTGTELGPIKCIWYDALSARSTGITGYSMLNELVTGQYKSATAFAEVWLDDVLIDPANPKGKTWIDKAKHIIYLDNIYEPIGEIRLGLATAAPYILMIVLKGAAGYDE
jgi:hypothetical protein